MNKQRTILILLIFGLAFCAFAQNDDTLQTSIEINSEKELKDLETSLENSGDDFKDLYLGIANHNLAQSNPDYIKPALEFLEKSWEKTKNALALVYLGSAQTMEGGNAAITGDYLTAMGKLSEGIENMDKAAGLDPDNIAIRTVRMINGFGLMEGSPVSRVLEIEEDLEFLKKSLKPEDKDNWALYWYCSARLALLLEEWDEVFEYLENAVRANPESGWAKAAEDLLWQLEE